MRRPFSLLLIVFVVGFAGVWLKVWVEAGESLSQAQELEEAGDVSFAIVCYRRTIRWYTPGSGAVATAVSRLQALGKSLEDSEDTQGALLAYRAVRTGLLGVQSVFQPYSDEIAHANQRIALLMARHETNGTDAGDQRIADRVEHHSSLLEKSTAPHLGWSLGAVFGFVLWCLCLMGLIRNGFDDATGHLIRSRAGQWAIGVVLTAGLWMTSLALA